MADKSMDGLNTFTAQITETVDTTRKMRVGIIGCGWIAASHIKAYLAQPDVEVVAGADLIPGKAEAFFKKYGVEGVKQFILDTVFKAGPNPCPPIVVGVGIGGTFERAAQLAKKATFRPIDTKNEDERYAALEDELLSEINKMGFGPAGLGGNTTAIGVNIETSPTHIAGMPVAVNICCPAARHASTTI